MEQELQKFCFEIIKFVNKTLGWSGKQVVYGIQSKCNKICNKFPFAILPPCN